MVNKRKTEKEVNLRIDGLEADSVAHTCIEDVKVRAEK
jgi:hypothetical protein